MLRHSSISSTPLQLIPLKIKDLLLCCKGFCTDSVWSHSPGLIFPLKEVIAEKKKKKTGDDEII